MRGEMSPGPPDPGAPEKSGGIFREIMPGTGIMYRAGWSPG